MRLYLPVTLLDVDSAPSAGSLPAGRAHAVTPALRALFPDEDDEGLEYAAQLAAADDSLDRLGAAPAAPRLRVVLAADVDAGVVDAALDDEVPSAVHVREPVPWSAVVCAHVDEPAAADDVAAALTDDDAMERLDERDLLWYDRTELGAIPR
ncbi:DUF6912 family protein [uncultured Cellulomonas sp.]|uniref:DUF6912 family protein n=1 Tax=uncultured Cellulomonas sp. TaxID=189682 RepID=UPI0026173F04|nr:hypothetical protein [uncultured Cellulomonas sp.]